MERHRQFLCFYSFLLQSDEGVVKEHRGSYPNGAVDGYQWDDIHLEENYIIYYCPIKASAKLRVAAQMLTPQSRKSITSKKKKIPFFWRLRLKGTSDKRGVANVLYTTNMIVINSENNYTIISMAIDIPHLSDRLTGAPQSEGKILALRNNSFKARNDRKSFVINCMQLTRYSQKNE